MAWLLPCNLVLHLRMLRLLLMLLLIQILKVCLLRLQWKAKQLLLLRAWSRIFLTIPKIGTRRDFLWALWHFRGALIGLLKCRIITRLLFSIWNLLLGRRINPTGKEFDFELCSIPYKLEVVQIKPRQKCADQIFEGYQSVLTDRVLLYLNICDFTICLKSLFKNRKMSGFCKLWKINA